MPENAATFSGKQIKTISQLQTEYRNLLFNPKLYKIMKNHPNPDILWQQNVKKLLLIMKISLFLIMVTMLNAYSTGIFSQNATISISMQNVTVRDVISEIERQGGINFLYNDNLVGLNRRVSVSFSDHPIKNVLDYALAQADLMYEEIKDDFVVLLSKTNHLEEQQIRVTGRVTDDQTGEPLPGVSIVIVGTTIGTISNVDGQYSLSVPDSENILRFSFVGYITRDIAIEGRNVIDISLIQRVEALDEIVVVGYGTVTRRDLTGSVGQVRSEGIQDLSVSRVDQALRGQLAGVEVIARSGTPGESPQIRIRGIGSISAGTSPLYVIDGYPTDGIEMLNPNDIETIDILKDASATAIYGSRGANGVILITTKRGEAGVTKFDFSTFAGFQATARRPEFLTAEEEAWYYYYGVLNQNIDEGRDISGNPLTDWHHKVPQTIMDVIDGRNTYQTEMLDHVLRTAPMQSYSLTASGGTEAIKYALSGEYMNQEGIIIGNSFSRYSIRANVDSRLSERLMLRFNMHAGFTDNFPVIATGGGGGASEGIMQSATNWHAFYPAYNEDGSYFVMSGIDASTVLFNPIATAYEIDQRTQNLRLTTNANAQYRVSNTINLNFMGGIVRTNGDSYYFRPSIPAFFDGLAIGSTNYSASLNWITESTLNYNNSFGNHNLTGLLGFTTQKNFGKSAMLESRAYPNNLVRTLNAVGHNIRQGTSSESEWSLISYLSRINYNYLNRYYLTMSMRADGSSRFGRENKYGYFPSVAVAWRISEENILNDVNFITDIKLRASYGLTGNNDIGNYAHLATITRTAATLGNGISLGYAPGAFQNDFLTWEKQRSFNTGIDGSFLVNRFAVSLDYFRTVNYDLLLSVNVPLTTGFNTALQNIGSVENKGWEVQFNTRPVVGNFNWSADFNFSTFQNKVLKLGPEGAPIISGFNITEVGHPMGMFYGLLTNGIFLNQAEIDAGPLWNPGRADQSRPGDIRFVDVSGPDGVPDGVINSYDRTHIGSPYPNFYYGMTNRFSYRNVSLQVNLQGVRGNKIYSDAYRIYRLSRSRSRTLITERNYWKSEEDPGDGKTVRPQNDTKGGIRETSDRMLDTGSFLRINNIVVGYTFSDHVARRLRLNSLRAHITATNPVIITNNMGFSPEVQHSTNPLQPGREQYNYPVAKSLMIGLNVSF
jgi:TonB-linked SusC/RagA family outer membrane protein